MSCIELYDEMYTEVVPHGWLVLSSANQFTWEEMNKPAQNISLIFKKDVQLYILNVDSVCNDELIVITNQIQVSFENFLFKQTGISCQRKRN